MAGWGEGRAEFAERFAAALVDSGMPRMPARVFAFLLSSDEGSSTAGELAKALTASPAAISGAVRYLVQVRLVVKDRLPGERRDTYRLRTHAWYEALYDREHELTRWAELSREGACALGETTPAGRRISDTAAFFEFLGEEMALLLERWRERQGPS